MDWFKKHADAVAVISVLAGAILWMNGQFKELHDDMTTMKVDMAVIKTVLIMKGIMPESMVSKGE